MIYRSSPVLLLLFTMNFTRLELPAQETASSSTKSGTVARQATVMNDQISVEVSVDAAGPADSEGLRAVTFVLKNTSKHQVGFMHVMDDYKQNVAIAVADELNKDDKFDTLFGGINGSPRWIKPGETLRFQVKIPSSLFEMKGQKFVAAARYFGNSAEDLEFVGRAYSKPFLLSLPK